MQTLVGAGPFAAPAAARAVPVEASKAEAGVELGAGRQAPVVTARQVAAPRATAVAAWQVVMPSLMAAPPVVAAWQAVAARHPEPEEGSTATKVETAAGTGGWCLHLRLRGRFRGSRKGRRCADGLCAHRQKGKAPAKDQKKKQN